MELISLKEMTDWIKNSSTEYRSTEYLCDKCSLSSYLAFSLRFWYKFSFSINSRTDNKLLK